MHGIPDDRIMKNPTQGTILDQDRFSQKISFEGLELNGRCFTDIDAIHERKDCGILLFEVKREDSLQKIGQIRTMEALVRNAMEAGQVGYAFIVEHDVYDTSKEIKLIDCKPIKVFSSDNLKQGIEWVPTKPGATVLEIYEWFTRKCDRMQRLKRTG